MTTLRVEMSERSSAYRALVLAHAVDRAVTAGVVTSAAEAARRLRISAQHMKVIHRLVSLAPDLQAAVLDGAWDAAEYRLRDVARHVAWDRQRAACERVPSDRP